MSYLDDANHEWEIDPACEHDDNSDIVRGMLHLAAYCAEMPEKADSVVETVLRGYEGLRAMGKGNMAQCFGTSMVWMFG